MKHTKQLVIMQWVVIAVLVAGGAIITLMLTHKTDDYRTQLSQQQGDMASIKEQLRQARNPTPTPGTPLPEATSNQAPTKSATLKP